MGFIYFFVATLTSFIIICAATGEMIIPLIVANVNQYIFIKLIIIILFIVIYGIN
jgi:hypothetical protein